MIVTPESDRSVRATQSAARITGRNRRVYQWSPGARDFEMILELHFVKLRDVRESKFRGDEKGVARQERESARKLRRGNPSHKKSAMGPG